jgi:steroid 5-alpha reductase family enzyme
MAMLIVSLVLLLALFLATWWLSQRLDNYSLVDVTWSLAFAPVVILYASTGTGWAPRRLVIAALVATWSLRLGLYLWGRVARHHPKEDARYAILRQDWAPHLPRTFLFFFLAQAALVWLLTLPVYLICSNASGRYSAWEIAGAVLWFVALFGEGLADAQLKQFKHSNSDPHAVCQQGLWHYSRHPNYFFQSLLWWGLFLMALPQPWGWLTLLAPLSMLYFLLRVTGIPLTEQLAVASKGAAYQHYQQTTSAFLPLPRRHSPTSAS